MAHVIPSSTVIKLRLMDSTTKNQRQGVPEEGVVQHHIVQVVQLRLIDDITVDEEKYWQIHFFSRSDLLLFEAETFNLGEVRSDLVSSQLRDPITYPDGQFTLSGVML